MANKTTKKTVRKTAKTRVTKKPAQLSFTNRNRLLIPFIVLFAVIGSYFVYRSMAATPVLALPGQSASQDCSRATGIKIKETQGSKKELAVCELSAVKTLQPIYFNFNNTLSTTQTQYLSTTTAVAGGTGKYFKTCYNLSTIGGSASFNLGGYAVGSQPGTGTSFTQDTRLAYVKVCDPITRLAGNTLIYMKVSSGTVRVASVELSPGLPPSAPSYSPSLDTSGASDVSDKMAAFLASVPDGSTINMQVNARYRMEKTFNIDNRRNLTIRGNGATILATTTGDLTRAHIRITSSSHIHISNLKVIGANPMAGAKDTNFIVALEGQHAFDVVRSSYVTLDGISASDLYGDFVHTGQGIPSDHLTIRNFIGQRSGRQAVAITSATNVLIENSTFNEAKRSTFDIEPGAGSGSVVDNVIIRNNTINGGRLNFVSGNGHGKADNVTIEGNKLINHVMNISVVDLDGGIRRNWKILNNTGDLLAGGAVAPMVFTRIDGLTVTGNTQPLKPLRNLYGVSATNSCNVNVSNNVFANSVGQVIKTGTC